jgi:NAD(P)-dependent dehydrogenase (short-subunit alcohol dehydrogenase family)
VGAAVGIRVNAVRPGQIETPTAMAGGERHFAHDLMTANQVLARPGLPIDVANAVVYLSSDESSFITATVLDVDGGLLCKP